MKTIEEKAKAYDEAIKRGLDYIRHTPATEMVTRQDIFEAIFPELAESEDEKIKKFIKEQLYKIRSTAVYNSNLDIKLVNAIDWLEKQDEKKPIEEYNDEDYGIDGLWHAQRILERTLGEVDGYQSDDGILEHKCAISAVKKLYEQKPIWGEEDECYIAECINAIATKDGWSFEDKRKTKHWLKSLKQRYTWKPSEEQIKAVKRASDGSRAIAGNDYLIMESLYNDLKKL